MKKLLSALLALSLAVSAQAVIVGASIGYLTDAKEAYYAARVGIEFSSTNSLAQIGEFEIGYTSQTNGSAKGDFMPVTVNYRAQFARDGKIGGYVGFGAGFARTSVTVPANVSINGLSDSGTSFAAQGFAGVSFKLSDTASFNLGARYIWLDNVKLFGTSVHLGDDTSIEAGLHFKF